MVFSNGGQAGGGHDGKMVGGGEVACVYASLSGSLFVQVCACLVGVVGVSARQAGYVFVYVPV